MYIVWSANFFEIVGPLNFGWTFSLERAPFPVPCNTWNGGQLFRSICKDIGGPI